MATPYFSNPADPTSAEDFEVTIKRLDADHGLIEGPGLGPLHDRLVQWGAVGGTTSATFEISADGEIYKSCRVTQVALPDSLEFVFIAAPQD